METVTIITILVIAFLVAFLTIGWCKGFLRIILTTLSLVATLVIAAFLLTPVTEFLTERTDFETAIEARVEKRLGWQAEETAPFSQDASGGDRSDVLFSEDASEGDRSDVLFSEEMAEGDRSDILFSEEMAEGDLFDEQQAAEAETDLLGELKLPGLLKTALIKKNTLSEYLRLGVANFKQYVVRSISLVVLKIATYIALVILIYLLIRILFLLTRVIEHIPIIRGINRLFGAVVGFVEGALLLWIICLFISLISHTVFGGQIVDLIHQSVFLSYLYEENLVLRMVNAFFTLF